MRKPKKLDPKTPSAISISTQPATSSAVQRIARMTKADLQNLSTEECLDLIRQLLEENVGDTRKKVLDLIWIEEQELELRVRELTQKNQKSPTY